MALVQERLDRPEWQDWQKAFDQIPGPLAVLDLSGRIIYLNPAAQNLSGFDHEDLIGEEARNFIHPDDYPEDIDRLIAHDIDHFHAEKRIQRWSEETYWVSLSAALVKGSDDRPFFFLMQFQDTTAQHRAQILWQRTVDHAPVGMALVNLNGFWGEVNDKLCHLLGYSKNQLLSMHLADLAYGDSKPGIVDVLADLAAGRKQRDVILQERYRHKDGYPIWMVLRIGVVLGPDDRPAYFVSQYEPLGDGAMLDRNTAHMALHDPLTGLANRALLFDRLDQELTELANSGHALAIILVDMNNLKPINDNYGHVAGDRVLMTISDELLAAVEPGNTVARLGGDEFVVLSRVPDFAAARILRYRISEKLKTKVVALDREINVSASVGLTATRSPRTSVTKLLHRADCDMYMRKRSEAHM